MYEEEYATGPEKMNKSAAAGRYGRVEVASVNEMQRPGSTMGCAEEMTKGMQKLMKWAGRSEEACRIVNKSGKPVVVRAKYKDVWEGQQWRLAAEGGQMVVPSGLLKSAQPYCRLGAFLDADPSRFSPFREGAPLYITGRHLLSSPQYITLSLCQSASASASASPSHTQLHLKVS